MNLKRTLRLIYGLAGLAILCAILILVHPAFSAGCILAILAVVLVNLRFWRCPACGKNLGRTIGKYCPHCGAALGMD